MNKPKWIEQEFFNYITDIENQKFKNIMMTLVSSNHTENDWIRIINALNSEPQTIIQRNGIHAGKRVNLRYLRFLGSMRTACEQDINNREVKKITPQEELRLINSNIKSLKKIIKNTCLIDDISEEKMKCYKNLTQYKKDIKKLKGRLKLTGNGYTKQKQTDSQRTYFIRSISILLESLLGSPSIAIVTRFTNICLPQENPDKDISEKTVRDCLGTWEEKEEFRELMKHCDYM